MHAHGWLHSLVSAAYFPTATISKIVDINPKMYCPFNKPSLIVPLFLPRLSAAQRVKYQILNVPEGVPRDLLVKRVEAQIKQKCGGGSGSGSSGKKSSGGSAAALLSTSSMWVVLFYCCFDLMQKKCVRIFIYIYYPHDIDIWSRYFLRYIKHPKKKFKVLKSEY